MPNLEELLVWSLKVVWSPLIIWWPYQKFLQVWHKEQFSPSPFRAKKISGYLKKIFDFLGIRIRLPRYLKFQTIRSESDYLLSDDIRIRLFDIRSITNPEQKKMLNRSITIWECQIAQQICSSGRQKMVSLPKNRCRISASRSSGWETGTNFGNWPIFREKRR